MTMSSGTGLSTGREPSEPCFATQALVPETKRHLELRTLLYQVLELPFAEHAAIGCDPFVAGLGPALGLSRDPSGHDLFPTADEKAAARVRELEAELQRRASG